MRTSTLIGVCSARGGVATKAITWMIAVLFAVACEAPPSTAPAAGAPAAESVASVEASAQQMVASTSEQAQRLNDALARAQQPPHEPAAETPAVPTVRWLPGSSSAEPALQKVDAPPTPFATQAASTPAVTPTVAVPSPDLARVLQDLRQRIRAGEDPAIIKALAAAGLSLADPQHGLDVEDLTPLDRHQREMVSTFHRFITALAGDIAAGRASLDAQGLAQYVEASAGATAAAPLSIPRLILCRSVKGFGVYEPFTQSTFTAGRVQPIIVYVELDHFRSTPAGDQFEVRLSQEVVLYNASDGLAVWRQPKVNIIDQSRNRRRDFFVVQLIRLPANLTVGKYLLKVTMTDLAGGSIDEKTAPIQVVADQSLVSGREPTR